MVGRRGEPSLTQPPPNSTVFAGGYIYVHLNERGQDLADVDNGNVIIVIGVVIILGQYTENVYAFKARTAGGITGARFLQDAQQRLKGLYGTIAGDMADDCNFYSITAKNRTTGLDLGSISWDTSGWAARSTSDPLPLGVAGLVTFPTTASKRRGRKFIMGLTEGATTAALFTAGTVGNLLSFAGNLLAPQTIPSGGAALDYVILSEGVGAFTTYNPTGATISYVPAYQRRRKQGVGR